MERRVGKFEVDCGDLLLSTCSEQVVRLAAIDSLGRLIVALPGGGRGFLEPGTALPRALGKRFADRREDFGRLGILALKRQGPPLQVGKAVNRLTAPGDCRIDGLKRFAVGAVLHPLPDRVIDRGCENGERLRILRRSVLDRLVGHCRFSSCRIYEANAQQQGRGARSPAGARDEKTLARHDESPGFHKRRPGT